MTLREPLQFSEKKNGGCNVVDQDISHDRATLIYRHQIDSVAGFCIGPRYDPGKKLTTVFQRDETIPIDAAPEIVGEMIGAPITTARSIADDDVALAVGTCIPFHPQDHWLTGQQSGGDGSAFFVRDRAVDCHAARDLQVALARQRKQFGWISTQSARDALDPINGEGPHPGLQPANCLGCRIGAICDLLQGQAACLSDFSNSRSDHYLSI